MRIIPTKWPMEVVCDLKAASAKDHQVSRTGWSGTIPWYFHILDFR